MADAGPWRTSTDPGRHESRGHVWRVPCRLWATRLEPTSAGNSLPVHEQQAVRAARWCCWCRWQEPALLGDIVLVA